MDLKIDKIKELMKDPQIKRYLQGGIVLAIGIFYLILIILPTFVIFAGVSAENRSLKAKIDGADRQIEKLDIMKTEMDKLNADLKKRAKRLPAQKEITGLLESFATLAKISDVKIISITPYELKKIEGSDILGTYYREMPIKITAQSGYHQLGRFITRLQQEQRLILIDDLQISFDAGSPRMHNVQIMVKTYVSLDEKKK